MMLTALDLTCNILFFMAMMVSALICLLPKTSELKLLRWLNAYGDAEPIDPGAVRRCRS